jgi:conjugal transfer/type IV secretion protein DotA/TraY
MTLMCSSLALAGPNDVTGAPDKVAPSIDLSSPFQNKPQKPTATSPSGDFNKPVSSLNILAPSNNDQSIYFLRQIFGPMQGNILGGGLDLGAVQGSLLGRMMEVLNYGVMVIAGFLVSYIVITGVLNTAQDGEFMGRNFKGGWIVMRVVFGSVLLLPNQLTGYSLAQWLVMWMAVQGIGLADTIWKRGLDYLDAGGSMYSQSETISDKSFGAVHQLFLAQVCMLRAGEEQKKEQQKWSQGAQGQGPGNINNMSLADSPKMTAKEVWTRDSLTYQALPGKPAESSCGQFTWAVSPIEAYDIVKRLNAGPPEVRFDQYLDNRTTAQKQEAASCGSFRWFDAIPLAGIAHGLICADYQRKLGEANKAEFERFQQNFEQMKKQAEEFATIYADAKMNGVKALAAKLMPAAKAVVAANGKGSTGLRQQVVDAYISGILAYTKETEYVRQFSQGIERQFFKNYYRQMVDEGWVFAGRYYHVLGWIRQQTDSINNFFFNMKVQPPASSGTTVNKTAGFTNRGLPPETADDFALANNYGVDVYRMVVAKNNAALIPNVPRNLDINDDTTQRIVYALLSLGLTEVQQAWSKAMQRGGEPITKLQTFGKETLNIVTGSWIAAAVTVASVMLVAGWGSAFSAGPYIVLAVIAVLVPLYVTVSMALFISALVFGFYLPLIPYILFTFAVFGWAMFLVIGILVAPLMALLLIYPEGHDWVGRAEQGVLLLVSIFIRPALLVLGLIIAMLFSKASIDLVNAGFDTLITDLKLTQGFAGGLALTAFMIIYTSILFIIIQQIFSTCIVRLPGEIEKLIGFSGGGAGTELAASGAQQVEQGFSQASEKIGQAGGGAISSAHQASQTGADVARQEGGKHVAKPKPDGVGAEDLQSVTKDESKP